MNSRTVGVVGAGLLAASGVAWVTYAVARGASLETWNCGAIAASYALLFAAYGWRPRAIPAALAAAAAANTVWLFLYPLPPLFELGTLYFALFVGGLLAASVGVSRRRPLLARAGFAATSIIALVTVVQGDLLRSVNGWTPGNVLALAGFVVLAARPMGAAPAVSRIETLA